VKLVTFLHNNQERVGVKTDGDYYLLEDKTMIDLIRRCEHEGLPDLTNLKPISGEITLFAPIPRPFRHIICLGKNYEDHAKEVKETIQATQDENLIPKNPIIFTKTAFPAPGDGAKIPLHEHLTKKPDYEAELGVIIGKTIYCATREEVEGAIFGYTIINDLTARDIQVKHAQWFFGKSLDGFCPMGPHIVTRDEIPFPPALDIKCRVNGETRQSSNTSYLIFDIPYIISELSQGITLHAGDIIATGTPAGIGHAMTPPQYLKRGDVVECEIEKIGVLTNYF